MSFKRILHRYKLFLWRSQHEISQKLLTVLEDCDGLAKQLKTAKAHKQLEAVEKIAKATLDKLPTLASISKRDPNFLTSKSIAENLESLSKDSKSSIAERLQQAQGLREEYVAAYGFVACPLCSGIAKDRGLDCHCCGEGGEMDRRYAAEINFSEYNRLIARSVTGMERTMGLIVQCAVMSKRWSEDLQIKSICTDIPKLIAPSVMVLAREKAKTAQYAAARQV